MKLIIVMIVTVQAFACYSNLDCGYGSRCVKINGPYSDGVCTAPQLGMPSVYQNQTTTCYSDGECGFGKRCVKGYGATEGICSR